MRHLRITAPDDSRSAEGEARPAPSFIRGEARENRLREPLSDYA